VTLGKTVASVKFNYLGVKCVHHLRLTKIVRPRVEYAFDVPSVTGSCIPNPKSYRLFWLDREKSPSNSHIPTE